MSLQLSCFILPFLFLQLKRLNDFFQFGFLLQFPVIIGISVRILCGHFSVKRSLCSGIIFDISDVILIVNHICNA